MMKSNLSDNTALCMGAKLSLDDKIAIALFWCLALVLTAQVLSRYLLNAPLGWTEEVARYQLILLAFMGASQGFRKHTHISFTYFQLRLPSRLRSFVMRSVLIVNATILLFLIMSCVFVAIKIKNHEMSTLNLSFSYLYSLIAITLFACFFRAAQQAFSSSLPPSLLTGKD